MVRVVNTSGYCELYQIQDSEQMDQGAGPEKQFLYYYPAKL